MVGCRATAAPPTQLHGATPEGLRPRLGASLAASRHAAVRRARAARRPPVASAAAAGNGAAAGVTPRGGNIDYGELTPPTGPVRFFELLRLILRFARPF